MWEFENVSMCQWLIGKLMSDWVGDHMEYQNELILIVRSKCVLQPYSKVPDFTLFPFGEASKLPDNANIAMMPTSGKGFDCYNDPRYCINKIIPLALLN